MRKCRRRSWPTSRMEGLAGALVAATPAEHSVADGTRERERERRRENERERERETEREEARVCGCVRRRESARRCCALHVSREESENDADPQRKRQTPSGQPLPMVATPRLCSGCSPVCIALLIGLAATMAVRGQDAPPSAAKTAKARHVFTNSFLVRLRDGHQSAHVDRIAQRNGFENLGPVRLPGQRPYCTHKSNIRFELSVDWLLLQSITDGARHCFPGPTSRPLSGQTIDFGFHLCCVEYQH